MVVLYMRLLKFKNKAKKVKDYIPTSSQGHVAFLISNDVWNISEREHAPGKRLIIFSVMYILTRLLKMNWTIFCWTFLPLQSICFSASFRCRSFSKKKKKRYGNKMETFIEEWLERHCALHFVSFSSIEISKILDLKTINMLSSSRYLVKTTLVTYLIFCKLVFFETLTIFLEATIKLITEIFE